MIGFSNSFSTSFYLWSVPSPISERGVYPSLPGRSTETQDSRAPDRSLMPRNQKFNLRRVQPKIRVIFQRCPEYPSRSQ